MYCGKCGAEITNGLAFCPNCGNRLVSEPKEIMSEINSNNTTVIKSKKKKKIIITIFILVLLSALVTGFAIYYFNLSKFDNNDNSNTYYRSKSISYGLVDYDDASKGLKVNCTTYYNQEGLVIREEREDSITNYSYDNNNRIVSIEVDSKEDEKTYLFNFTYEKKNEYHIGTSNSLSEYVNFTLGNSNLDYGENSIYWEYRYDDENRLVFKASYYNNEALTYEKTEYYDNGKIKILESYQGYIGLDNEINGSLSKTEYDENENVIFLSNYDSEGNIIYKFVSEYRNNKPYKATTYDSNGIESIVVLNKEYDSKYEFTEYDKDNNLTGYNVITYDSNGNITKSEYYDENFNSLDNYIIYKYDEKGNQILFEEYTNGLISSKSENTYTLKLEEK